MWIVKKNFFFQIFAVIVIASTTVASYQSNENSPIQIISIRPSTGARMLPIRRDGRYNKNINNNIQRERDGPTTTTTTAMMSPIIKIVQIQRKPKQTKYQRQFQLGLDNGHSLPLHIAPGAYPVYYAIARANGLFKGNEIRSFKLKQFWHACISAFLFVIRCCLLLLNIFFLIL